jgi:hypothetical protein
MGCTASIDESPSRPTQRGGSGSRHRRRRRDSSSEPASSRRASESSARRCSGSPTRSGSASSRRESGASSVRGRRVGSTASVRSDASFSDLARVAAPPSMRGSIDQPPRNLGSISLHSIAHHRNSSLHVSPLQDARLGHSSTAESDWDPRRMSTATVDYENVRRRVAVDPTHLPQPPTTSGLFLFDIEGASPHQRNASAARTSSMDWYDLRRQSRSTAVLVRAASVAQQGPPPTPPATATPCSVTPPATTGQPQSPQHQRRHVSPNSRVGAAQGTHSPRVVAQPSHAPLDALRRPSSATSDYTRTSRPELSVEEWLSIGLHSP